MRLPRHLWSGSWLEESERVRRELDEQGRPIPVAAPNGDAPHDDGSSGGQPTREQPAPTRRPRRGRRLAAVAVPAVALAAGGYALGVTNGGDSGTSPSATRTLPAATSSAPLQARAGKTRTGAIYAKASPAVVSIRTSGGSGTGFLVDNATTVVTNAHVVDTASTVTVRFGVDGRHITGRVLGTDPSSDLAVVQLPSGSAPAGARPLELADSTKVAVGDAVVAIGNPFGLDRTATVGIISGLGREIQAPNGFSIEDAIQTDAAINPGNSGGPLLDDGGRVVGVNSQIETGGSSQGNVGIGFAVPSNSVRQVVPQLEQGHKVSHAWLGIESGPSSTGSGAVVHGATAGGPADQAGIGSGDEIVAINGQPIQQLSDISRIINAAHPGDRVQVRIRRGGRETVVPVTLGTRPAQVPAAQVP